MATRTSDAPKAPARAEVLCVGSELLGGRVNTHMSFLAPALLGAGLRIRRETSVGDSVDEIRDAAAAALQRSNVLLVTGGLGPTFDDLTREGVAQALGLRLRFEPAIFRGIERKLRRYRYRVPEENKRQAYVLEGATVLPNRFGSAPGQRVEAGGKAVFLLPGPAAEMKPMMIESVLPYLRRRFSGGRLAEKTVLRLCGIPESAADERLDTLYATAERRGLDFTILAEPGLVDLHVTAFGTERSETRRRLERARADALRRIGRFVYGSDGDTLESVLGDRLRRGRRTLAAAESCTGGLLAKRVTDVPGSSAYFLGGVVCYSNRAKERELSVAPELLRRHGAVSRECARAMALGARRRWESDWTVAITGIAGPGGGSKAKPVGLTYIALAGPDGRVDVREHLLAGARETVRQRAATAALTALLRRLG